MKQRNQYYSSKLDIPMFSLAFLSISIFLVVSVLFISRFVPTKYMYNYIINVELITTLFWPKDTNIENFRDSLPLFQENNKYHVMKNKRKKKNQHYILKLEQWKNPNNITTIK